MSKLSMFFAVAGLVCNILMLSISGVPVSIPLGIFGIAFAVLSKDTDKSSLTGKGKTSLVLSIVAIVFGLLIYIITLATTNAMSDPTISRAVIDTLRPLKEQMPDEMLQMFEQAGISLE